MKLDFEGEAENHIVENADMFLVQIRHLLDEQIGDPVQ